MKRIVTNLEKLAKPSDPIKFLDAKGIAQEDLTKCKEIVTEIKARLEHDNLLALSAPQIGINVRVICIKFNDGIKTFIDPIISKKQKLNIVLETCASMPGKEIIISRPTEVFIKYYNEDLKYEDNKLLGIAASLFDQQFQLLDGILPDALGMISDIETDGKITEDELSELAEYYKKTYIPTKLATLHKQIEEADDNTKKEYKKLKFMEGVINGHIAVVHSDTETDALNKANELANKSIRTANIEAQEARKIAYRTNIIKHQRNKKRK